LIPDAIELALLGAILEKAIEFLIDCLLDAAEIDILFGRRDDNKLTTDFAFIEISGNFRCYLVVIDESLIEAGAASRRENATDQPEMVCCSCTVTGHVPDFVETALRNTIFDCLAMILGYSFDPGALVYLLRQRLVSLDELEHALDRESGLAGLSGTGSGDVREATAAALDVFVHRVAGAIASMAAACGGIDALVFTGGIGEHAADVREAIVDRVRFLGAFAVEVVTAREELVIAAETRRALGR